ncbi:MAG: hypothetical protein EZS28_023977 [Streblomastix strix]|uniref:Uncharacterized protein n=1 Tax=Streblomastix strix TaxID=222440 RepID=A0A5J4VD71_9EUKA|nr:MAG: hypothetical protein EZS28_023977 [Streblomastix strix]
MSLFRAKLHAKLSIYDISGHKFAQAQPLAAQQSSNQRFHRLLTIRSTAPARLAPAPNAPPIVGCIIPTGPDIVDKTLCSAGATHYAAFLSPPNIFDPKFAIPVKKPI